MSLFDNINEYTDKHTIHSYLTVYDHLFKNLKHEVTSLLEIGIDKGGSLYMLYSFFNNAVITGIDIELNNVLIQECDRIKFVLGNTYSSDIFYLINDQYDIIIDDGSHLEEDFVRFLVLYVDKFKYLLIIEDIYDINICFFLITLVPHHLKQCVTVYDRRRLNGRYDDILFIIDKRDTNGPKLKTYFDEYHYKEMHLCHKSLSS